MFPDLPVWIRKLSYLKSQLEEFEALDRSWYGPDQWDRYHQRIREMKLKVYEYERLVEYLLEKENE